MDKTTKKTVKTLTVNFGIRSDETNMQFVKLFGSEPGKTLRLYDRERNRMTVDAADRFDKDVIDQVASWQKYTLDLSDADARATLLDCIRSGDYNERQKKVDVNIEDEQDARERLDSVTDRTIYLTSYDMASAVAELLPQYKGKLRVTGRVRRYYYNGRFIDDFEVQNIYAVKSDEKSGLALKVEPAAAKDTISC